MKAVENMVKTSEILFKSMSKFCLCYESQAGAPALCSYYDEENARACDISLCPLIQPKGE